VKEIKECHLCGGRQFKFLYKNHDRLLGLEGEFSLWRCSCGLVFLNPQPDVEEIAKYYPADYAPYAADEDRSVSGRFLEMVERACYDSKSHPWLKACLLPFRPLVRGALIRPGGRLLDFGCGSGHFLLKMKKYGLDVYGIDFNKAAISRAREKFVSLNFAVRSRWMQPRIGVSGVRNS